MDFWYWDGIGYEDTRYEEAMDDYWEESSDLEMGFDPYMGCYSDDC